jgi:hypothetical protein
VFAVLGASAVAERLARPAAAPRAGFLAYVQPAPVDPYPPGYVGCIDRKTLQPVGPVVEIPESHGGWALSPDKSKLAMTLSRNGDGGLRVGLEVIDLASWRVTALVHTGVYAEAVLWTSPTRLLTRVSGSRELGPESPAPVVSVVDARSGNVLRETDLPRDVLPYTAATRGRLATLATSPPRLVAAAADGSLRSVRLSRLTPGLAHRAALLTDPHREVAYVFAPGRPVAEVALERMRVRYHDLRQVERVRATGRRTARALTAGSDVPAQSGVWLRDGVAGVVVPGLAASHRRWRVAVVDTRRWQVKPIDHGGTGIARAPQGLIAYGPRGVRGYRFDGRREFVLLGSERLFPGRLTSIGDVAYASLFRDGYPVRAIDPRRHTSTLVAAPGPQIVRLMAERCPASSPRRARSAVADQSIYALLGTGALVRTTTGGAKLVTVARVARSGARAGGGGPYLVRSGQRLFAAFPGARDSLFRVDLRSGHVQRVQRWRGIDVRALLVGPRTRRVYAVGDGAASGGANLVVKALSADGTKVVSERVVKHPAGTVWGAALSSNERRMAVAYHGDSEGFDLLDPATLELACRSEAIGGCIEGHGSVAFAGSRLFSSTGGRAFTELQTAGATLRRDSRLPGSHILEFAQDPAGRFLYMSGTCAYTDGISRFDLRTRRVDVLAPRDKGMLCGTRLLVTGDQLVLGANNPPFPEPDATSHVRIVDRRTGKLQRSIPTPGSIVDIETGR